MSTINQFVKLDLCGPQLNAIINELVRSIETPIFPWFSYAFPMVFRVK